jgi:hypothetical protein
MSTLSTSNITSGFVDLATYDELEKYLYGGPSATAYFVRETRKATWFTLVPVVLSRSNGSGDFGTDHSVNISRAGDYLLAAWLRVQVSAVSLTSSVANAGNYVRWTPNFMHNLIAECCITFNDLSAARFDNYHLDFWAAFTVPAGKLNGYNNMIGNFGGMTGLGGQAGSTAALQTIESYILNLPLPFFFARDSGVALPTAALPYNEMRITYSFRAWTDLLIIDNLALGLAGVANPSRQATATDVAVVPSLTLCQTWANYAIVSNDERKRMACAPRNILIEQVQTAPPQTFSPGSSGNPSPSYDLRFSHAIKVIFFAARNTTVTSQWSNYTAATMTVGTGGVVAPAPSGASDPIITTSLTYENTARLSNMGSDYFSLVQPWYHAVSIPTDTGYHMYSYSLDFICLDPKGSTNYGKLTNVSIAPVASVNAIASANGTGAASSGASWANSFRFITTVVNNNIIRISGGALGFPVL